MRKTSAVEQRQRGQALMLAVLALTVIFIIGAIAVDFGLWLSERRGSQTDADFIALAGAWELLDPAGNQGDAVNAANAWFDANDEQLNATLENIIVDDSCFNQGEPDAVVADVRHSSRTLFSSIFGMVAPEIGAHAKACAGATNGPNSIIPFEIDNDTSPCFENQEPMFTALCGLDYGAQGGNPRGIIDLEAPDDNCSDSRADGDIANLIEWGANGTCLINEPTVCDPGSNGPWYDCVAVQTGNTRNVIRGTAARIAREGICDRDGDGVDSFAESVEIVFDNFNGDPYDDFYQARDCDTSTAGDQTSPRLVNIIVLDEDPAPGNTGVPIYAFASFYIAGCLSELVPGATEDDVDKDCDEKLEPNPPGFPGSGAPGHKVVYGRFVKLIVENSGVGPPNSSSTSFSIALVE